MQTPNLYGHKPLGAAHAAGLGITFRELQLRYSFGTNMIIKMDPHVGRKLFSIR